MPMSQILLRPKKNKSSFYLAYDSFARVNGALGTTETTDPNGLPITARTWIGDVGTFEIVSNSAKATVLDNDLAIVTVDTGRHSVIISANITNPVEGSYPQIISIVDGNNYITAFVSGSENRVGASKYIDGVETTLLDVQDVVPYSAGVPLKLVINGTSVTLYYNNILIDTATVDDAVLQTSTKVGFLATNTADIFDEFSVVGL